VLGLRFSLILLGRLHGVSLGITSFTVVLLSMLLYSRLTDFKTICFDFRVVKFDVTVTEGKRVKGGYCFPERVHTSLNSTTELGPQLYSSS